MGGAVLTGGADFAMQQCILMVQWRDDTRWHVCEIGSPRSLASFGLKEDAIEYARDLARTWSPELYCHATEANGGGKSADAEEAKLIGARAAESLAAGRTKKARDVAGLRITKLF
jgi:hypothetical protein